MAEEVGSGLQSRTPGCKSRPRLRTRFMLPAQTPGAAACWAPADSPSEVVKWNARPRITRRSSGTTSATSSVGRIRSRLPIFAGAHDEVAGAIPVPAELLDHAEQSLRRLDKEAHALRQVATKRLSPWCCSGLCFHPTPSRVGRSGATAKPQDGSPPKLIQAAAPPPYGARTRTACRKSLSPRSPALGRAHHECAPPDKWVKSRFRKLRLFALPARVAAAADHERRSRGESRSAPIHQGR